MMRSLLTWFRVSAGVVLVITGIAKIVSALGNAPILQNVDPVFDWEYGHLLLTVGALELAIAVMCISDRFKLLAPFIIAWFATNVEAYRLGLWQMRWQCPCPCLGSLTDGIDLSPQVADEIMNIVLAYLLLGSYGILLHQWWKAKADEEFKMKSLVVKVVLLIIIFAFPIANIRAQPTGEYKGSLVLAFFNNNSWHSNFFSVDVQSRPPHWHLILKSSDTHEETFAGSNQLEIVTYYDDVSPTSGLNTADIKLFEASRPLNSRLEEHIWAALFSRNTFLGKQSPLDDIGLCIAEPCVFTEFLFNADDASPRSAKWHNARADKYDHQSRIEGTFQWISETNLSGDIAIPLRSDLAIDIINPDGERTPASFSELAIENISPLASPPQEEPIIKGRAPVFDYRFGGMSERAYTYIKYDTFDGQILSTNSQKIQAAKSASPAFENSSKPDIHHISKYFVATVFLLITLAFIIFALLTQKNKQQ